MKSPVDTPLNWYFYLLYSAFIWGYVVVRLLCGYSWGDVFPVVIVWFLTCVAWYVNWSIYMIKRLEQENERLRSKMEEISGKKGTTYEKSDQGHQRYADVPSVSRGTRADFPGRAVYADLHGCPHPQCDT